MSDYEATGEPWEWLPPDEPYATTEPPERLCVCGHPFDDHWGYGDRACARTGCRCTGYRDPIKR